MARSEVTLDELAQYLEESGIQARTLASPDAERVAPGSCAVVLFPDDFDEPHAMEFIRSLRDGRPRLLLIVVTREPTRLERALGGGERGSVAPVVLPRPSFGWSIVDVIRAHRQSHGI